MYIFEVASYHTKRSDVFEFRAMYSSYEYIVVYDGYIIYYYVSIVFDTMYPS